MLFFDNYSTSDIIKVVKDLDFKLFKDNFKKNKNSFPYVKADEVNYIVAKEGDKVCGILAYSRPYVLEDYRRNNNDLSNDDCSHIFGIEVLEDYRGQGIASGLLLRCIWAVDWPGVTLRLKDEKLAGFYKKFGFEFYPDTKLKMVKFFY